MHEVDYGRPHAQLVARIERFVAQGDIAGAAVVAAQNGEAAPGLRASHETPWPIASLSKVYTAATIMWLIELG